ncbi:hypothetical protein EST62_04745 [Chlorobaculum sp. 24CR]|uniref:hypothetical protein n=1 Tax=Chlorobaculum sp. 24CR TaxID=2508878 RepID=UPI00100AAD19|nr:hypothetical protein [Chlorobaculum sp. 24CR]RXK88014.1 hypothetical protein EST62_04745 [Chlorobaculum sp. 24CR]
MKKIILTIICIALIVPVIALTIMGFIVPFYKILCAHISTVPCTLPYVFDAWVVNRDWSFLSAIGTIGAVIVALFQNPFLKWYNRPKLSIMAEKGEPYTSYNLQEDKSYAMYLRLQLNNDGNSIAKNVAIRIKEIRVRGGNNSRKIDMYINPENIGVNQHPFPDIPSGAGMYWDFGMIEDKKRPPVFRISTTYPLAKGYHILEAGKYDIDIHIVGDKIKRTQKTIEVDTSQLMQWPVISDAKDDDEKRKREEEEVLEKITFKVKNKNSFTDFNTNNCHRVKKLFYAFKSCIKERLVEIEKRRMSKLSHSRPLQKK